jgi:SAM-dependent methyltransferase
MVVSNQVIEHAPNQTRHLCEIRRVLRARGCVYLATPNRSSPIMEGHIGNDLVLRYREMGLLIRSYGFQFVEYGVSIVREPERYHGEVWWARFSPTSVLKLLCTTFPSHVFVLTRS